MEERAEGELTIRYIQIEDLRNNNNIKYTIPNSKEVIAEERNILIAWDGANAGTVGMGLIGAVGSTLAKLTIKSNLSYDIHPHYVGLFLKSKNIFLRQTAKGATIPHLDRKVLENLQIPLPSLERQKEIVKILDQAQMIIEKRKSQLQLLNELKHSIFYEMFGKYLQKSNDSSTLKDYIIINPSKNEIRIDENDLVTFLPMANVGEDGTFVLNETRQLKEVYKGFTYFKNGDVLLAKITPSFENGKGGVVDQLVNGVGFGTTELFVLRPNNEQIIANWLYYLCQSSYFRSNGELKLTGSAGQKRIPRSFIENFSITIPDIGSQKKFTRLVEKIDSTMNSLRLSLNDEMILQNILINKLF